MHKKLKPEADAITSTKTADPTATAGEAFADGSIIELIRGARDRSPKLMLWDGTKETIGTRVEHIGQMYAPVLINASVLQELILPACTRPHGTTRVLLAEISELVRKFGQHSG